MAEEPRQPAPPAEQRGPLAVILWACFLGSSWTWVIGMLFPVLLLADYGIWGWVVFAVPNVLGAAAFGFVLSHARTSRAVLERHDRPAIWFSTLTVAFHVFVVGWIYLRLFGGWGPIATGLVAVLVWMLIMHAGRLARVLGTIISAVSLAMLLIWLGLPDAAGSPSPAAALPTRLTAFDLLMFAPAAIVGFALCPYLDLTFHRARQRTTPATGKAAFALGFGVVFLAMIVFSLLYAPLLRPLLDPVGQVALAPTATVVLAAHLTLQAGFTVALHAREVAERQGHDGLHRLLGVAIAAGALAYWAVTEPAPPAGPLSIGEMIYRAFLLLYGLVFPAYVWLCMIPTRRPVPSRACLGVYATTLIVAVPMAYMGFIVGASWWMLAALVMLGIGRLAVASLPPLEPGGENGGEP